MKLTGICPKCGSKEVIANAQVIEHYLNADEQLRVATFTKPESLIFKGKSTTGLSAWVCGACGFTELYADRPRDLRQS